MLCSERIAAWVFVVCVSGTLTMVSTSAIAANPTTLNAETRAANLVGVIEPDPLAGLIGTWEASKFGHQVLTTRPNGTATIQMSLSPLAAALYGRRVTLNLEWSLEGDALTHRIVGGAPERSVEKLIRKYGDTYQYRLVAQDKSRLLIADVNSSAEPVAWTAVKASAQR